MPYLSFFGGGVMFFVTVSNWVSRHCSVLCTEKRSSMAIDERISIEIRAIGKMGIFNSLQMFLYARKLPFLLVETKEFFQENKN